jgi:sensor domain CHASE-containing protein
MGLRTRTFTTLTIIMVVLFVALFLVARPSLNYAFNRLERDRAKADGERLVYAYGQELERLERIAADWAPRNVTLEYMRTGDPERNRCRNDEGEDRRIKGAPDERQRAKLA